jgi:hypothetical protein
LPGVWPLHCHIGWHLSEGKLAAFVYLPEKVKQIDKPEDWRRVSLDTDKPPHIPHADSSCAMPSTGTTSDRLDVRSLRHLPGSSHPSDDASRERGPGRLRQSHNGYL